MEQPLTVAYACNRAFYQWMPMAVGSLLRHNPDAQVIIYAEDDEIPEIKHSHVKIINIDTIPNFISEDAPNAKTKFTKFSLVRCYFPKILDYDKILWLDVDTVVLQSLDELWNTDISRSFVAGVMDVPALHQHKMGAIEINKYINTGVCLMNLSMMRKYNIADKIIKLLNGPRMLYPDQDAINVVCYPLIKLIDPKYNCGTVTPNFYLVVKEPFIRHYTFLKLWDDPDVKIWRDYYITELKDGD